MTIPRIILDEGSITTEISPYGGTEYFSEDEIVIITKDEAKALVMFLSTQWLDRHVPYLSDALDRLQISIKE